MPLALLLLGGMELNGYSPALVHGFGATLFVSRAAHAWGLSHSGGTSKGRFLGSLFTWLLMLAMAVFAIAGFASQYRGPVA
jgi:uncharacterized membrane protein YecN with MAPEG domain